MKKLSNLGKSISIAEQKVIHGGASHLYVCIENFPFVYYVAEGQLCDDGGTPLCP